MRGKFREFHFQETLQHLYRAKIHLKPLFRVSTMGVTIRLIEVQDVLEMDGISQNESRQYPLPPVSATAIQVL